MISRPIDKIEYGDIQALVDNRIDERQRLEFKRELPGTSPEQKRELCADATSFANASGGDIIYGVAETEGVATEVIGLPNIDADAAICRIQQTLQSGIDPRLPGVWLQAFRAPGRNPVIVLRIEKSWRTPHFVKINDTLRMYGRHGKGKYIFDAAQIRSAFLVSEGLAERIKRWRDDRLARIIASETPVPIQDSARLIIHVIPHAAFSTRSEVSVSVLRREWAQFSPPFSNGGGRHFNIDGFLTAEDDIAYCQVFRSGCVEGVRGDLVETRGDARFIPSAWCEKVFVESIARYVVGLSSAGVSPPYIVFGALVGAKGVPLSVARPGRGGVLDRDVVVLPEVVIDSRFPDPERERYRAAGRELRPVFDAFWNAFGHEKSPNYDQAGEWVDQ